ESSKVSDFSSIQPSTKKDGGARPATTVESVVATNEPNVKPTALKDGLSSTSKLASGDLKSISNIPSISSLHDKYGAGPERPPSSTKPQRDASKSPIPRSTSNLDQSKQLDTKVTSLTVDVVNPRDHLDSHDHYVEYEVVSTANIPGFDAKGDVRRRYKDFAAFRNDLTHEFPGRDFPELPPATTVQFSKDKEVIEKRRVLFSKFLKDIADDDYLHTRAKALRKFFQEATYVPAEKLPTHLNVDHVKYTALEVDVLRPQIQYDGVESYVDYEITSISKIPNFDDKGNVRRSYRDFEAFRNDLSHEFPNRDFPNLPLEDAVKFSKSPEFNETCRILFAQFLKKIAEDHYLHTRSKALQKFLHDKQYQPTNEIPRPRGRNIDAAVSVTKHHDENKSSATQIAILGSSSHLKPTSVPNSNLLKVATSSEEDTQSASSHNDLISPKVKQVLGLPEEKHHVEVQGLNARTASQASLKARHLLGLPTGTSTDPHSPSGQSPGGTSPTVQKEKLHALRADLEAEWDKIEAQERAKHETDVKEIKKAYKQKLEAAEEAEEEKLRKLIKEVKAENTRSLEVLREGNEAAIQRLRLDFAEEELQIKADGEKRLASFRATDVEQREKFIAAQAAEFESYQEELKSKYRSRRMQLESEEQERYNSHARDIQSKHEAQLAVLKEKLKETQEQTLASNLTNLSELERIKYENEQESIRQKYEIQLAELKSKEQRKFESLRMEVESSTEVKLHEIKEAARKRITEEREASEKLIAAAEQDAKTKESLEKSRIQMEHSRQLDRLRLELDSELRKTDIELRQQYTLDFEALKLSSLKEADENKRRITNDHARMISMLEADYARKIDDIKTKLYMGEKEEELRVIMETEQELEQRRQKVISQQREVAQLEREVEYARQRVSLEKDALAQMERGVTTAMAREKGAYRAGLEQ
ncbi:Sorting nexin-3, partial [Rhizoclosmatium hyalinum]